MASIQDIRTLETRVTDIVDDYIRQQYNEDDVLAIGRRCGKITEESACSRLNGMPTHRKRISLILVTCLLGTSVNFFKFLMNKEQFFRYSS